VKVNPFTVADWPAANALKTTVSVDFVEDVPKANVDTGLVELVGSLKAAAALSTDV
jgi:hypothetical protein